MDIVIDIGFYTVSAKYLPLKSNLLHFFKIKHRKLLRFPALRMVNISEYSQNVVIFMNLCCTLQGSFCHTVPGPCEPEDLIDGIIFAANYLGCTQVLSDKNPSKSVRMSQAHEAVSQIKVILLQGCYSYQHASI